MILLSSSTSCAEARSWFITSRAKPVLLIQTLSAPAPQTLIASWQMITAIMITFLPASMISLSQLLRISYLIIQAHLHFRRSTQMTLKQLVKLLFPMHSRLSSMLAMQPIRTSFLLSIKRTVNLLLFQSLISKVQ